MWACPHCREALQLNASGDAWACANNHQFDCAKEGYVNLLPANRKRSLHPGDSPEMMAARRRVHSADLYRPLADAIENVLSPLAAVTNMLDLGCGEGYYGAALQRAQPQTRLYGVDIARPAVRMASKRHQRARFAVASAYRLPLLDDSQDVVLRVFAPSDDAELRRVLAPQGWYLEVTPAARHLWELREQLYDTPRAHSQARTRMPGMGLRQQADVAYQVKLDQSLLRDVVAMTPFAHRGHREKREQLLQSSELTVQMAFSLCLFQIEQKSPSPGPDQ
jgi:23S rRNA (guanine745-N1)-methyltransferase